MMHEHPNLSRVYAWFSALVDEDYTLMSDLLAHGLPVDILHPLRHTTALMEATRLGRANSVTWLIEHGAAQALLCGSPSSTALHCALRRKHWEIAQILVNNVNGCTALDGYGATPLHHLCAQPLTLQDMAAALPLATKLILASCATDKPDHEGATALHHCAINNHLELATLLLGNGANPNAQIPESAVSPLMIAALEKNLEMAKLLIRYGADPHVRTRDGTSPLSLYPIVAQLITEARVPKNQFV